MAGFGASSFHDQVTWAALWQMLSEHGAAFWKLTWCVACVYIKHVTCVWCWHMLTVWLEIPVFFEWFWMYTWCLPCQCDSNFRRYRWATGHPSRCRSKAFETRSETRWRLGPWAMPPSLEGFVPATFGYFWCVIGDGLFKFISFHHRNLNWQWKTTMGRLMPTDLYLHGILLTKYI